MAKGGKGSPNGKKSSDAKGKAKEVPPSPAVVDPVELLEDNDLLDLADAITARAHVLVPGKADLDLARRAQEVVKASFDRALASESSSFPHLSSLLQSLSPSSAPSTRSSSKEEKPTPTESAVVLTPTPLEELTTDGMDPEMVWEQMEMRAGVVVELLEDLFGNADEEEDGEGPDFGEEGSDEEAELEDEDESDSDEDEDDVSGSEGSQGSFQDQDEYFSALGPAGVAHVESDAEEEEEEEAPVDPLADENAGLTLDTFDTPGSGRPQRRAPGPPSAVDDNFFSLHDFHVQADEGEYEMAKAMRGEVDSDSEGGEDNFDLFAPVEGLDGEDAEMNEDADEEDLDGAGLMYKDFFDPPPKPFGKDKGKGKDDGGKKGKKGKGKGKIESDPTPAPVVEKNKATPVPSKKRKVTFSDSVKVKTIAPRGSAFDKLVAKVGWEEASRIIDAQPTEEDEFEMEGEDEEEELGSDGEGGEEDVEMEDG
ncbi:U3 small nucleolar RNA-associated protein MPP10, partial [Phenoliferia sp. Uapishka_3]